MAQPVAETPADPHFECDCGHSFTKNRWDIRKKVVIYELETDLADFDVSLYVKTRKECPICSCCYIVLDADGDEEDRNGIEEVEGVRYMCGKCLEIHDDEDDAKECCTDE